MNQVSIIAYKIVVLGLLGMTGFIAGRTRYLPDSSGVIISRLVVKLTAPLLIFTTLANSKLSASMLVGDGLLILILSVVFLLIAFCIGKLVSDRLDMPDTSRNIYKMHSIFGNVIFLAYPLIDALYSEKGLIYAVFFSLANDTVLWTIGIYLVNKHNSGRWQDNLKHLVNGNTIAFSLGVLTIIFNLQYFVQSNELVRNTYTLLYNTFNPLGQTTIYLSMLFIGLILSEVKISSVSELMSRYPIFILSAFKLLLVPVLALVLLSFFGKSVDPFIKTIIVLQLAMPCGTIVPALAAQYESDYKFAGESVFVSTVLGIFTLPLMVYLINAIGL